MDELEQKLGAVLNNPQLMQQIMSMAQAMGSQPPPQKEEKPQSESAVPAMAPQIDPGMLSKLAGLSRQSGIDREQQALLKALNPYLSKDRISRLERAMRAAKMAKLAGSFLGSGLLSPTGR